MYAYWSCCIFLTLHCWVTVPLCPLALSFTCLPVSPMYWGCVGQILPPRLQVIQYTTLVEVQVNLPLTLTSSPVAEHFTEVTTFFSLKWSHTGQLDCLQGWKPSPFPLLPQPEFSNFFDTEALPNNIGKYFLSI